MDEQRNQDILGHFDTFSRKQEVQKILGSISFEYLWPLNVMQNMKKARVNPEKNAVVTVKWTNWSILGLLA